MKRPSRNDVTMLAGIVIALLVMFQRPIQYSIQIGRDFEDRYGLAFLVNPVRVEQVIAIADGGELMPQKSTFFYPKLGTGLVLDALEWGADARRGG